MPFAKAEVLEPVLKRTGEQGIVVGCPGGQNNSQGENKISHSVPPFLQILGSAPDARRFFENKSLPAKRLGRSAGETATFLLDGPLEINPPA